MSKRKRTDNKINLITLHGGCFVGGSASYDKKQNKILEDNGFIIHQVDFIKDKGLNSALQSIRDYIKNKKLESPLYVIGRSSGGYLAKCLFDEGLFQKAIYIAPIFSPILRGKLIPHLGDKQAPFFIGQMIADTDKWSSSKELLFLASDDSNCPDELFTSKQLSCAIRPDVLSHSALCISTSNMIIQKICEFIKN
jgi:predicted esterase YcpF (UPF0227 family)